MVSQDRQQVIETNRSLRNIKNVSSLRTHVFLTGEAAANRPRNSNRFLRRASSLKMPLIPSTVSYPPSLRSLARQQRPALRPPSQRRPQLLAATPLPHMPSPPATAGPLPFQAEPSHPLPRENPSSPTPRPSTSTRPKTPATARSIRATVLPSTRR